jgi:prepilin-type N-terminal cleavage/methylation domain-containing protein
MAAALHLRSIVFFSIRRARGVTLIELLVGLAIATLMTLAGWRAIDAMQVARDMTVNDAARWQSIDNLFSTIESDLRRADLSMFSGDASSFTLRLNPLTATDSPQTVRYRIDATDNGLVRATRFADTGAIALTDVRAARFSYRMNPKQATPSEPSNSVERIGEYPRAIEIALEVQGNANDAAETPSRIVNRILVLR